MKNKLTAQYVAEYKAHCENLVRLFEKKHGYEFDYWVGDDVGGIASFIEQYYFNMGDILYDLDNDLPKEMIFAWQDYCIEQHFKGEDNINLHAFSKGVRI